MRSPLVMSSRTWLQQSSHKLALTHAFLGFLSRCKPLSYPRSDTQAVSVHRLQSCGVHGLGWQTRGKGRLTFQAWGVRSEVLGLAPAADTDGGGFQAVRRDKGESAFTHRCNIK